MSQSHHQDHKTPHRTKSQTAALSYVFINGFVFWALARSVPAEDTTIALVLFGLTSVAAVVASIGMWKWKRWGAYLYCFSTLVLGATVLLKTGLPTLVLGAILPMFVVAYIFIPAYKDFS